jgi:hypothetical protein
MLSALAFMVMYFDLLNAGAGLSDTQAGERVLTILPTADSSVSSESRSDNKGESDVLQVDGDPIQDTYLQFDLSELQGLNVHARLRLYAVNSSPSAGSIAVNSDAVWDEDSITYENRPSGKHVTIGTLGEIEADQWYEVNVTPGIAGNEIVTFVITSTDSNGVEFSS